MGVLIIVVEPSQENHSNPLGLGCGLSAFKHCYSEKFSEYLEIPQTFPQFTRFFVNGYPLTPPDLRAVLYQMS
ncbi:MAG: hypothetical protein AAB213_05415 [Candidatus Omnitrophota bacterium]